jgi:hypothetical protein
MAKNPNAALQLKKIISMAEALLKQLSTEKPSKAAVKSKDTKGAAKRVRRSGKELEAFRKMLKAERAKGVPVAELCKKHGVSTAYIYTL